MTTCLRRMGTRLRDRGRVCPTLDRLPGARLKERRGVCGFRNRKVRFDEMRSMKNPIRMALSVAVVAILAYAVTAARAQMSDHMMMPVPKAAKKLQASVNNYKTQLTSQGKYTCCSQPTCDFCAPHMGGCAC